jgi:hypothetical protein
MEGLHVLVDSYHCSCRGLRSLVSMLLTSTHVHSVPSSLTQVVRHIDSLTIDYQRQSTFGLISLASSKSAGRCSRRRNPVQANWCSVVLGVVNNLAVLAQTSRVPFGRVSMFADCPGAFQFSPPKGSITRGAQTQTAAARGAHYSPALHVLHATQLVNREAYPHYTTTKLLSRPG